MTPSSCIAVYAPARLAYVRSSFRVVAWVTGPSLSKSRSFGNGQ